MVDAIRADVASINKQFQSQRQEAHDQREKMLATNYSNTMTESKLDELLVYYRSNEGRRYQAFMQEIQVDIMNAITDITGKGFSSGMVDLSDTSQLSAKEQSSFSMSAADKLRVLRLSHIYRIQLARGDAKIALAMGNLMGVVAARYGEEVDHIRNNHRSDIATFEKFSQSSTVQLEIAGLVRIANVTLPVEKQLKNEYLAELASYRVKWRQLYINRIKP